MVTGVVSPPGKLGIKVRTFACDVVEVVHLTGPLLRFLPIVKKVFTGGKSSGWRLRLLPLVIIVSLEAEKPSGSRI